jgi:surface polysaccharide O-acyltransferase-like enzyme
MFTVKASAGSYAAYIIHPIIVVSITMFLEALTINPIYKFFILAIFSVILSFLLGHIIRMIPGIRKIL